MTHKNVPLLADCNFVVCPPILISFTSNFRAQKERDL